MMKNFFTVKSSDCSILLSRLQTSKEGILCFSSCTMTSPEASLPAPANRHMQLTSGETVYNHVFLQMLDIVNIFCEQTLSNNLHFYVFLVQVPSVHGVRFLLCWWLMVDDRPTLLYCKALSLVRIVNEYRVKCWFLHSVILCTYYHDIWEIDDKTSHLKHVLRARKLQNFWFLSFPKVI